MDKLISSGKLIRDLIAIRDTLPDIFLKNVMSAAISCVEKQPAADVRRAEWIDASVRYDFKPGQYHICSICEVMIPFSVELPIFDFCPKCGNRMYRRDDDVQGKTVWHSPEGDSK